MFELKTTGFDDLSSAIAKLEKGLSNLRPELMAVGKVQQAKVRKRFRHGGNPQWEDITYFTRKQRLANRGGVPMTEIGDLAEHSTMLSKGMSKMPTTRMIKGRRGSAFNITDSRLTMGSLEARARALQEPRRMVKVYGENNKVAGNPRGDGTWEILRKKMPARPFLYFDADDRDDFTEAAGLSIENRMRELFK